MYLKVTPTAFLRQGSVQTIVEDRIAAARNTLSVASRADLDESLYSAVNSAVSQMENARTARDISRANQLLTTAVSELTASASTSALSDVDRKSLSRAADDFTEQGSFLRQEAKTYNEKADKALYKAKHFGKHGCAFYGVEDFGDLKSKSLSQMQMLLSERDGDLKAYIIDFEQFKAVYRFVSRQKSYSERVKLLQCTFDTDDDDEREKFFERLTKSLSRADCMTRYGREQFLILTSDVETLQAKLKLAAQTLTGELTAESAENFCR